MNTFNEWYGDLEKRNGDIVDAVLNDLPNVAALPAPDRIRVLSLLERKGVGPETLAEIREAAAEYRRARTNVTHPPIRDDAPGEREEIEPMRGMPSLPKAAQLDAGMGEGACPWLDQYIEFSRHWSPRAYEHYHEAVGLWLLSTIAARRVMLHFGGKRYTNLTIALVSRTSVFTKSRTVGIAIDLLTEMGLLHLLAPDDSTPQAFLRNLEARLPDDYSDLSPETQKRIMRRLAFPAQRGWFYEEFGQKVNAMMRESGIMADFRGLLRRFDECPDSYAMQTISRGDGMVERPYLALLCNMTPADLIPYARKGAALWNDGFWARFAFVAPPEAHPRGHGRYPDGERKIPDNLKNPLQAWHHRLGVVEPALFDGDKGQLPTVIVSGAMETSCTVAPGVFDAFYGYHDGLVDIAAAGAVYDLDGNYSRFAEKALRVAMLLASMENGGRIEMRHWARAQAVAERWREGLHNLYEQVAQPKTAGEEMEEKLLAAVKAHPGRKAYELGRYIRGVDTGGARLMLKNLVEAGVLYCREDRYYCVSDCEK